MRKSHSRVLLGAMAAALLLSLALPFGNPRRLNVDELREDIQSRKVKSVVFTSRDEARVEFKQGQAVVSVDQWGKTRVKCSFEEYESLVPILESTGTPYTFMWFD
ncbi:hypothetical protein IT575_00970 [bacterium]|nr:hypothetical protein [bacterium]